MGSFLGFLIKSVFNPKYSWSICITEIVTHSATNSRQKIISSYLQMKKLKAHHCWPVFTTLTTAVRSYSSNPHPVDRFNMCEDEVRDGFPKTFRECYSTHHYTYLIVSYLLGGWPCVMENECMFWQTYVSVRFRSSMKCIDTMNLVSIIGQCPLRDLRYTWLGTFLACMKESEIWNLALLQLNHCNTFSKRQHDFSSCRGHTGHTLSPSTYSLVPYFGSLMFPLA